uniref:Uncharacterized protein n=1 Tax=Melopsittacus undulatus TaxID=13146 RepID=A0A8C6J8G0_MELUD
MNPSSWTTLLVELRTAWGRDGGGGGDSTAILTPVLCACRHKAVAEQPSETPSSPQMSPEQSKKHHSEMQTRPGSQSSEPKAKSTHQVVWEVLPAEISILGSPQGASSVEEDPVPGSLKEERFSLLRDMDDATAALSKQLKPQAPGAPPAPANTAHQPQDDAEPQMGLEEATAHGTTPRVKQETLSGHVGHKLFEGDMEEGPGTTPDVPQAGASMGAGHHRAQEQGEEEQRMLFPQGKGGGVKEAEHLQGALGENTEAGEQVQVQVEGAGWMQENRNWEEAQLLGEAEEVALSQGEKPEAGLGSPGAGQAGLLVQQCLGMGELPPAAAQSLRTGLGEEAQPSMGLSKEVAMKPGELLEPEPAPHAAMQLVEENENGEEGQGEHRLQQESVLDLQGAGCGQREGPAAGVQSQEDAESLDRLEDQNIGANMQALAVVEKPKVTPGGSTEADLQLLSVVSSLDTEQGGSVAPDVQTLDQVEKAELLVMEIEDWADMELHGGPSPETAQGGGDHAAMQLVEENGNGEKGQGGHGLQQEFDLQGAGFGQGEGAAACVQAQDKAVILHGLEVQSTDRSVQPLTGPEELRSGSGGSPEADVGASGMQGGEQRHTPGSDVAHTTEGCREAAGAHVSPPAEAISYPERAAAPKAPGVEAQQGALTGPDGQILQDNQTLGFPQGERAAPLDGAQRLEVGQAERLKAGVRSSVETQALGIKQGLDDGASAPAFPVSEVPLQISTLKLEAVMQEDVLIPDVWPLGASGQAAQSELQEQVSAQAEKSPHTMGTEKAAAGPAEVPKQEVPPASPLHTTVLQEEDAGNDQSGTVLGGSSLGDAASTQPQRQSLGEQSKDADQWKKKQEVARKMSQEGEPSPGNVAADGGSPKAPPDPDHLYNVLFVGDSHVGKTSFLYRLQANTFNPHLTTTVGLDYQVKTFVVDNKCFALRLWDSAGQERYHSITKQFFRKADGVVLMYDITSEYSFLDVQYWLSCIQEGAEDGVAILLLGNKSDCAAERQVPMEQGERLAKEHQLMFYECSAASGHNISESMVSLIRLLKVNEDKLKNKVEEVPKLPQKKKSCCW